MVWKLLGGQKFYTDTHTHTHEAYCFFCENAETRLKISYLAINSRHSVSLLYNILHTSTPKYLSHRFIRLSDSHNLDTRSQQNTILSIPLHQTTSYSSSFTVSLARTWNSLPFPIRDCPTLSQFKNKLKKYLIPNQQANFLSLLFFLSHSHFFHCLLILTCVNNLFFNSIFFCNQYYIIFLTYCPFFTL